MDALSAFEAVDFEWTQRLDSVWQSPRYDVPSLHQKERQAVLTKVQSMRTSSETGSPLGWVFVGPAGIGKTHLLSGIRREILSVPASFVLVDLLDVHDFWECVLLGFIDALQRPADADDRTQGQLVVQHIAAQAGGDDGFALAHELASLRPPKLARVMDDLVQRIGRTHRAQTLKHADTLRALVLLNSDDLELASLGHAWLQGYGVDESEMQKFGFNIREKRASAVVEGLSWLISLRCPMVVAFDQLDAIAVEHLRMAGASELPEEHAARQHVSRSIIDNVGRGFMELRDVTRRALAVVVCLAETWRVFKDTTMKATAHRYEDQRALGNLHDAAAAEHLVRARLEAGYGRVGFTPPHGLWPFTPSIFSSAAGMSPRELLRRCEQHRRRCLDEGRVTELAMFSTDEAPRSRKLAPEPPEVAALDTELQRLRASVKLPKNAQEAETEARLGKLLLAACDIVRAEQAPDPGVQISVETDGGGKSGRPALDARVRQIFLDENDRERHFCMRVLWRDHHLAFQPRLTAALTASGIAREIEFRKLVLVRNAPAPSGAKTTQLLAKARAAGAEVLSASDEDILELTALSELRRLHGGKREIFEQWLRSRRPTSRVSLMKPLNDWLARSQPTITTAPNTAHSPPPPAHTGTSNPPSVVPGPLPISSEPPRTAAVSAPPPLVPPPVPVASSPATPPVIAMGHQIIAERPAALQTILAEDLKQHVVVLAGAGSGKTVLLRRLIEECALLGIPSIVIDGANDLSRLGDRWPERPSSFTDEDAAKADRYHAQTDVVVWTPGRSNGNPLRLGLLPDFAAVAHDQDDFTQAVAMTATTLAGMASRKADRTALAILDAALRLFAQQGGGDLTAFLDLLADLPEEATLKISTARKVSTSLVDSLRAAVQTNPLLHDEGKPLDPGILFGLGAPRTRVSVLSLVGLPGIDAPLQFVNQLAMTLFTWVKKNPCPSDRPLRGLLVIDEAKDFVPSLSSTPCKESLIRLAAQGRKYGLGVVFATQAPKSIDHNVIANASTHFYGKASSPAAIDTVEEALRSRGATKVDVARLSSGRFYLAGKGMSAPVKIAVPLCLSHHPASPPDEGDVLRRAAASRARVL